MSPHKTVWFLTDFSTFKSFISQNWVHSRPIKLCSCLVVQCWFSTGVNSLVQPTASLTVEEKPKPAAHAINVREINCNLLNSCKSTRYIQQFAKSTKQLSQFYTISTIPWPGGPLWTTTNEKWFHFKWGSKAVMCCENILGVLTFRIGPQREN